MVRHLVLFSLLFFAVRARAEESEFNPFAPGAAGALRAFDRAYEAATGLPAYPAGRGDDVSSADGCYRTTCAIFVDVDKASQTLRLYLDGRPTDQWPVSTGRPGFATPDFNKRFDGRIYQRYDSTTYPGGDYMGLGNMPYAMFISGGVAIHGTPETNWRFLGRPASHGCIRLHPEHAKYLNGLLRQIGVRNSWVWVH
jgi:lipoprotein-anchoring transpeptidase ErfK/SrfK